MTAENSSWPHSQASASDDSHQPQQPRIPGHAPGDQAGTARQCHQDGALAGKVHTSNGMGIDRLKIFQNTVFKKKIMFGCTWNLFSYLFQKILLCSKQFL